jgi:hypothetical protein
MQVTPTKEESCLGYHQTLQLFRWVRTPTDKETKLGSCDTNQCNLLLAGRQQP